MLPRDTHYDELGLSAEASDDEVRWAKQALTERLQRERREVERRLERVYSRVDGLREVEHVLKRLRSQQGQSTNGDLEPALRRHRELRKKARQIDPEFDNDRDRLGDLEAQLHDINSRALDNPDKRLAYDREHPPFALMKIRECAPFAPGQEPRTMLYLLRRELSRHLADCGCEVFHPSDLTRDDFSGDFTFHRLLDGGEHGP